MRRSPSYARPALALIASAASLIVLTPPSTHAETWALGTGGAWNQAANWNPATIPNRVGSVAVFNGNATESNAAQTANRSITLDSAQTVGSIIFNSDLSSFTNTIAATVSTPGSLVFDEAGSGPATITTSGSGTGNSTISAPMVLNDSLLAIVDNTSASSTAGSLNLTGAISGTGGFTKQGDGTATFGTGAKTYTGATVLDGGRMRVSVAAQPANSSSFTVNAGAQLTPITAGTYTLGAGTLYLNGSGPFSGPTASFPGAIRQNTDIAITIGNPVVLQSDTMVHVQGAASGSLTFSGSISGPGSLTMTSFNHDANLGTLVLQGSNTYSGGTLINGGTVRLSGSAASLGTGDITVFSASAAFANASAKLSIETGVLNAIADIAMLFLSGGNLPNVADDGFIELQAGVNEIVGGLVLGGEFKGVGTYGSSASGATFKFDEYFSGPGIVTVIPEPSAAAFLLAGIGVFGTARCRRQPSALKRSN